MPQAIDYAALAEQARKAAAPAVDYAALAEEARKTPVEAESAQRPTWSDRLGLNTPTDLRVKGFLRGSGGAVVDVAQGAGAALGG